MYAGKFIFSQLVANLPMHTFRQCVARYQGERYVKQFRCLDNTIYALDAPTIDLCLSVWYKKVDLALRTIGI